MPPPPVSLMYETVEKVPASTWAIPISREQIPELRIGKGSLWPRGPGDGFGLTVSHSTGERPFVPSCLCWPTTTLIEEG